MNALEQAGITIVPNGDWLEASPLGRAEWLKVFGLLLGKPTKAQACFEAITQRYDSLQRLVKALPPSKPRPLVLTDLPYKGTWYVPAGQSYVATLLKDAGADYPWADTQGTGSLALDFEAVYAKAQQADLWLNTSSARQLADIQTQDPRLANFKPFVQKQVYNNNRHTTTKGGSTYFMQGIVEPHLILADLISIIHPELLPKHQQVYYHQLP
jgi:iron complex transport system substrate-binding protein